MENLQGNQDIVLTVQSLLKGRVLPSYISIQMFMRSFWKTFLASGAGTVGFLVIKEALSVQDMEGGGGKS